MPPPKPVPIAPPVTPIAPKPIAPPVTPTGPSTPSTPTTPQQPAYGGGTGQSGMGMGMAGGFKKGGSVRNKPQTKSSSSSPVSKASKRGDGIAQRGKTRGKMY